jgi:hypothetical protein
VLNGTGIVPPWRANGAPGLWGTNGGRGTVRDLRKFRCNSMLRFFGSSFMRRIFDLTMSDERENVVTILTVFFARL